MRSLAAVTLAFVLSGGWLFAQDDGLNPAGPLYMLNNGDRLMSASSQGLPGEISQLNFGPGTVPLFSFIRELDGTTTLHILNYLDNELVTVEPAVGNGPADGLSTATYDGQLSWRPQLDRQGRQWFAFVSNKLDNNQEIYLGYLGGEEYVRLTRNSANDFSPQWSPDGDKIAFISKRSGEGDLYLSQSLEKVVDGKSRPSAFIHRQLTDTPLAEAQPAWNPNPKAHLIAFTQRRQFAGRDVATTQIAIIDLGSESFDLYEVTADPLYHFYAPNWEPHSARRLMFVQQSVVQGTTAGIYLVELEWKGGKLHNKILEDYRTEIFDKALLGQGRQKWLAGGSGIICQKDSTNANNPLFSIDVDRWLAKKEGAVNEMADVNQQYARISEFDIRGNDMMLVDRSYGNDEIFWIKVEGSAIRANQEPDYQLDNPGQGPKALLSVNPYVIATGTVAAGVLTYFLLSDGNNDEPGPQPIGRPPGLPR